MMKKKVTLKVAEIDLPLVPLIDVLMQLLIFFMCGTQFRSLEGKMLSYLPKEVGIPPEKDQKPPPPPILDEVRIKLVYDEQSPLGTKLFIKKYGSEAKPVANWNILSKEVGNYFQQIRANKVEMPFIIDPESKIPAQAVVYALDACRAAGVQDVRLAAKSPVDTGLH